MLSAVGVVIVNRNGGEHLGRAVQCLERQTLVPRRIVVVDNASDDGSADALPPSVELVRSAENLGFAGANNLAVRMCGDCEHVALLNPDAFPAADWLETLVAAAARRPECGVFGSRLVRADDEGVLDGAGDEYHVSGMAWRRDQGAPAARRRAEGETFSACAAAAMYRRADFLAAGGFDESFFCYYEDTDLAFRLRLAGVRCLYVPGAVVRHVGSAASGLFSAFTIYHSSRNQVWTYVKNMPGPLLWLYLPQHVLAGVLTTCWYALRGQGAAALRGKRDALRGLPRVLGERRRIQSARTATLGELRASMSGGVAAYGPMFLIRARESRRNRTLRTCRLSSPS